MPTGALFLCHLPQLAQRGIFVDKLHAEQHRQLVAAVLPVVRGDRCIEVPRVNQVDLLVLCRQIRRQDMRVRILDEQQLSPVLTLPYTTTAAWLPPR